MNDKVKYWLETSECDLDTAKAMLDTGRYLHVGFTCHLTIEKCLKAVIAEKGEFPPKIHNLIDFAMKSGIWDIMDDEYHKFLRKLNPLNIAACYPDYRSKISKILTQEYCTQLYLKTKELRIWIKDKLS